MAHYTPTPAKGFPGWYEIPGYSANCANRKGELLTKKTGHVSQGGKAGRYLKVSVYPDRSESAKLCYLHQLICRAFHGPPKPGQVVLHKDNDRTNNRPSNLKWGTQAENIQRTYDDGLKPSKEQFPSWITNW